MKLIRGALALACLLPLAACSKGTAPLEVDYNGSRLTAARADGERRNTARLTALRKAAPMLHEVGSGRNDECKGGRWFDEDQYYLPYACTTTSYTVLTFAGEFRAQARTIAAALDASSCSVDLARQLEPELQDRDVTLIEFLVSDCRETEPYPWPRVSLLAWSPVDPAADQLERVGSHVDTSCGQKQEYCESEVLDLAGALASAPSGDRWAVVVELGNRYFTGEPTDG